VTTGADAEEVLSALPGEGATHGRIDLVVADLRLAERGSGLDAVATLRSACARHIPALVISGDTSDEAREEVLRAGVTLLHKPVLATALLLAAQRAVTARRGRSPADAVGNVRAVSVQEGAAAR
jgi:CheY-like chemotaxis protein